MATTTIRELLRDHVSLEVESVDRVYLNGYLPSLQTSGSLVYFLEQHRGNLIASPVLLGAITQAFVSGVEAFAKAQDIPLVPWGAANAKTMWRRATVAGSRRPRASCSSAWRKSSSKRSRRKRNGRATGCAFSSRVESVYVKTYYFYLPETGVWPWLYQGGHLSPYPVKVCLNGHEWAQRRVTSGGNCL